MRTEELHNVSIFKSKTSRCFKILTINSLLRQEHNSITYYITILHYVLHCVLLLCSLGNKLFDLLFTMFTLPHIQGYS
jgi:hypothetical protein